METILQNVLNLLTIPPGNLVFHLVLAFSVLASLQAALIWRRASSYAHANRLVFGLSMLLAGQVVLFLSSGLAWQGLLNPHLFLPPLARAITVFSLIWIVWLWNFPQPARLGDLVTGFMNLGVVILFIFTYTSWSATGSDLAFNNSWIDWIWELAALFVVLTGMAVLVFSRPAGWGFGVGMLSLSLAGIIAHLVLTPRDGDFSGLIRISQLAAFPLLPTLLNRMVAPATAPAVETQPANKTAALLAAGEQANTQPRKERRRYSSDPRTVHAWLELKEQTRSENVLAAMTKAIAHTMLSDMCFLASTPVYGQVILQCGYDLVREDVIPGTGLDQGQIPQIAAALQRGKALRYGFEEAQNAELRVISNALGLKEPGSLMILPIIHEDKPLGGFLLLSPYSNRQWTTDDQNYLASEAGRIARILYAAQNNVESQPAQAQPDESLIGQQAEIDRLRTEIQALSDDLMAARRTSFSETASPDITALIVLQQESQEAIAALQAENERLKAGSQGETKGGGISVEESERLEADLRTTLQEMAHLQNELARANAAILMFERQSPAANFQSSEDREVIAAITQEIRQPMSSILGYTDLLLAESVGILGALQRKFLERIRASTERMRAMLDDLIQVASVGGSLELLPKPVELGTIIDGAVEDTSGQLREKKITLRVDLPAEMPRIYADRDAIQQIVVHLLQNAGTATPEDGTITLRARVEKQHDESYLLLQVTDTGGGMQPEYLARVFNRRYRADKPQVQGLDDAGVGLSIAKTLVEAHGGRIWVDTEPGQSTTFSVLLPLRPAPIGTAVE